MEVEGEVDEAYDHDQSQLINYHHLGNAGKTLHGVHFVLKVELPLQPYPLHHLTNIHGAIDWEYKQENN